MHLGREVADRAAKLPDDDRHDAIVYVLTTRPADILAAASDSNRLGLDRTEQDANRHGTRAQAVNRTDPDHLAEVTDQMVSGAPGLGEEGIRSTWP